MEDIIKLKKDEDILRLKIIDENGVETGECLEFCLEDIELPLRYQDIMEQDKKNRRYLKNQLDIIEKKQDHKGKKLFSSKQEEQIKAMQDFYKKQVEIYNMFLGENGVEKLLNGRKLSWSSFDEIDKIIEECILPKLEINANNIKDKIIKKYSTNNRDDVIE